MTAKRYLVRVENGLQTLEEYVGPVSGLAPLGQELFPYAWHSSRVPLPVNAQTWAFAFVPDFSMSATAMEIAISATGGTWTNLGIYDEAGALLAQTGHFAPISGAVQSVPLLDPVDLVGGSLYYMAIATNDAGNTQAYSMGSGGYAGSDLPLVQRGGAGDMPVALGAPSVGTALRPWMAVIGE